MGFWYEKLIRPILFKQDAESAHDLGLTALDYLGRLETCCRLMQRYNAPRGTSPIRLFGIDFPNAVGLAAGMDKNGRIFRATGALGFGFSEIGTITYHKQPGNEGKRVFRFPEHEAIINRMGFNNDGAELVATRLKQSKASKRRPVPLGINIGKSKVTPIDEAVGDYLGSFQLLAEYADYMAINVSSPNTPGLRRLQGSDFLPTLLGELVDANRRRAKKLGSNPIPMLLKIAPDLSYHEIEEILATIEAHGIDGIIATNTTIARPSPMHGAKEVGGLSGKPLHRRSLEVVDFISRATKGRLPIIGVGGIDDVCGAGRMMDAGASLIQIYSGMVFKGPFLAAELARGLAPRQRDWV